MIEVKEEDIPVFNADPVFGESELELVGYLDLNGNKLVSDNEMTFLERLDEWLGREVI